MTRPRSSFTLGMSLLPSDAREALFAIYALARRIDDVADGPLSDEEKLARLAEERAAVEALAARNRVSGSEPQSHLEPVYAAVAQAGRRFPIPLEAFLDLVDGAEMDARGVRYESFDELLVYCRRVAGSIGRLALGVFVVRDRAAAEPLADDLGVAFQLTNILRDVREDLARGRCYVPGEDLRRFGVRLRLDRSTGPVGELVAFEAARAEAWYERGLRLLPLLDRRSATCVAAMAGVYRRLLRRIEREPETVLAGKPSLAGWEKGWVAARSLVAGSP